MGDLHGSPSVTLSVLGNAVLKSSGGLKYALEHALRAGRALERLVMTDTKFNVTCTAGIMGKKCFG